MGPALALQYCREVGGEIPDRRTAQHVVEWVASKAREYADCDDDLEAIRVTEQAALDLLERQ